MMLSESMYTQPTHASNRCSAYLDDGVGLRVVCGRLWEALALVPGCHQGLGGAVQPALVALEEAHQVLQGKAWHGVGEKEEDHGK